MRTIKSALLAKFGQYLTGLHGIPPFVVPAGVILGGQPAGSPVLAVESVLKIYLCLT